MAKLTKEDWLKEGIKIIAESAQDKIRILYLCKRLGVTRGSFYHHFESIDDYVNSLMEYWQEHYTKAFILSANEGASSEEKLEILNDRVVESNHKVEAVIRSWAFYNPVVKKHLDIIDQQRLSYLEEILKDLVPRPELAKHMAMIDYGMLIGIQQLNPNISRNEMADLYATYKQIFEGNQT